MTSSKPGVLQQLCDDVIVCHVTVSSDQSGPRLLVRFSFPPTARFSLVVGGSAAVSTTSADEKINMAWERSGKY